MANFFGMKSDIDNGLSALETAKDPILSENFMNFGPQTA